MILAISQGKVGKEIGEGSSRLKYSICEIYLGLCVEVIRCPCCSNVLRCPLKNMKYNGLSHNMSSDNDIFTKEIDSWAHFGYALRKENMSLFEEMLDRCKKKD